jgi:N-acylneuraminate cytidylyltransferase/CMP-N,N'-diacetyllegionaminic acid synthase
MSPERPKTLATICARGGSKGLPGKNLRRLLGKSLLAYAIECARACPAVGKIVISTDSDEIAAEAEALGVPVPFRRPAEFASDEAAKIFAIRHAAEYVEENEGFSPDIVVDLDVGVPLRAPGDIESCMGALAKNPELDGAVTVYEAERNPYFNMVEFVGDRIELVKRPPAEVVRRQDAPPVYSVTPSVFAYRRSRMNEITHLHSSSWGGCVVPRERAIDIDHEVDFRFVEFLMTGGAR